MENATDNITQYPREVVRLELAGRILADVLRLSTILGMDAAFRAVGLPTPPMPGRAALNVFAEAPRYQLSIHDIDVDKFPMGQVVMAMYAYAYEQQYPIGIDMDSFKESMDHVEDLMNSKSEMSHLFMLDTVISWRAGDADWRALPALHAMASARLRLDMGKFVFFDDLALLADMTPKSVRSAIRGTEELLPERHSSNSMLENDEARRWLSQRRGFVPTRFKDVGATQNQHPATLSSLFELGNYIHRRWAAFNKTPESVLQELRWSDSRFDYLNGITGSPHLINPTDCADLAKSLYVAEGWFTEQVFRLQFPAQWEVLQARAFQKDDQANVIADEVANDRLCLRLCFTLRDGQSLYPVRMKNRQTGKIAFRLSKGGIGGNTTEQTIEIEDENEMIRQVLNHDMAIRIQTVNGERHGLYKKSGRAVLAVAHDGNAV